MLLQNNGKLEIINELQSTMIFESSPCTWVIFVCVVSAEIPVPSSFIGGGNLSCTGWISMLKRRAAGRLQTARRTNFPSISLDEVNRTFGNRA